MSWWGKIKAGLGKTTAQVSVGLRQAVGLSGKLDAPTREALEEVLLQADVGVKATAELLDALKLKGLPEPLTEEGVKNVLAELIAERLVSLAVPWRLDDKKPAVLLMAGVNGSGKTTTIGKLAEMWRQDGKTVMVAAADTFRAGAVDQLQVWAERAGVALERPRAGETDPGGVAYRALQRARDEQVDILIIDTAGRLPNRADLMAELQKIVRVLKKLDPEAPHHTLLVLDATQGQATLAQARVFGAQTGVDGLVVTKLDGSAKAGFLLALAAEAKPVPVAFVGVGEAAEDIGPFEPVAFARSLVGLE